MPQDSHPPLRLALHRAGTSSRDWASLLTRTGLAVELVPLSAANLLLSHGPCPGAPAGLPHVEIPRWDGSGGEEGWRRDFFPVLRAIAASPGTWVEHTLKRQSPSRICLGADLISLTGGVLAGWTEPPDRLDAHGRPDPEASLLARADLLSIPVLDSIARQLGSLILRLLSRAPSAPPPWYCLPTLDLDSAGLFRRRAFPSYARRLAARRPGALGRFLFDGVRTRMAILKDPHCRPRQIGEILEGLGFPAAFLAQTHRWHPLDSYELAASRELTEDLLALRRNRYHQVGLHSSYRTMERGEPGFHRQWRELSRLIGPPHPIHRSHYLRFPPREPMAAPGGAAYLDSSLGFGGAEGFRRGTAFPFPLAGAVAELPPVVMDSTLIHHRGLGPGQAWDRCLELMGATARSGGVFVPIWHPNNMDDYLFPGWSDLFYDLLREARRRGARTGRFSVVAKSLLSRQRHLESHIEGHSP